jgi:hypothetical protein
LNKLLDLEDSYDLLENEYVLLDDEILEDLPYWVSERFSVGENAHCEEANVH